MFDFAWSEIALIGVVALIAIGPKDMPVAIKAISDTVKKLRRMAGEFQGHVDEMLREANLGDVKTSIDELRSLNPRRMVQRAIDPDGTVAQSFADPFRDHPVRPVMAPLDPPLVTPPPAAPADTPPLDAPPLDAPQTAAPIPEGLHPSVRVIPLAPLQGTVSTAEPPHAASGQG